MPISTILAPQTPVKAMCIINGEIEWVNGIVKTDFDDNGHLWYSIVTVFDGRVRLVCAHEEDCYSLEG